MDIDTVTKSVEIKAETPLSPDEGPLAQLPTWDRIRIPVLGVWSDQDPLLLEAQMMLSAGVVAALGVMNESAERGIG